MEGEDFQQKKKKNRNVKNSADVGICHKLYNFLARYLVNQGLKPVMLGKEGAVAAATIAAAAAAASSAVAPPATTIPIESGGFDTADSAGEKKLGGMGKGSSNSRKGERSEGVRLPSRSERGTAAERSPATAVTGRNINEMSAAFIQGMKESLKKESGIQSPPP